MTISSFIASEKDNFLFEQRQQYILVIVRWCAILFLPVIIYFSIDAIQRGLAATTIPTYATVYGALVLLAVNKPKTPPVLKGIVINIIAAFMALFEYVSFGLTGSGAIYLMLFVVFGILMFSFRVALFNLFVSMLIVALGGYIHLNTIVWGVFEPLSYTVSSGDWVVQMIELFSVGLFLLLGMRFVFYRLVSNKKRMHAFSNTLAQKQDEFELILSSIPSAVLMVDLDQHNTIRWSNGPADTMFGYDYGVLPGMAANRLFFDLADYTEITSLLSDQDSFDGYQLLLKNNRDDAPFWGQVSGKLVSQEDTTAALFVILDVNESTKVKQALNQAQKMESLGLMAGGIAHDFRNVLTTVKAHTSIAMRQTDAADRVHQQLTKAQSALDTAANLTSQLLSYASSSTADGHEVSEVDINALIRDSENLLSVSIPSGIQLQIDLCNEAPAIIGDKNQLQQVFLNLIINAAEAIGDTTGNITISTDEIDLSPSESRPWSLGNDILTGGRYLLVEVADSGSGMDAETLRSIFEPFFTTKETGTGLGLATVFGVVRTHSGGLTVDSELGHGTTFRLLFPVVETPVLQQLSKIVARP